jgi:succinate dehydrogenase / fumarate reductase cytochrome b subunit
MLAVYVIAMIAVCWHFAYGVWLFAAKWGITPGEVARKRFGYICAVLGVALAAMGIASIWAFVGGEYPNAPENVPVSTLVAPPVSAPYFLTGFRANS